MVTLTGRPGHVAELGTAAVTAMVGDRQPIPQRGLPSMPRLPTAYVVYMPAADWKKVQETAQPTDRLIVRGRKRGKATQ